MGKDFLVSKSRMIHVWFICTLLDIEIPPDQVFLGPITFSAGVWMSRVRLKSIVNVDTDSIHGSYTGMVPIAGFC